MGTFTFFHARRRSLSAAGAVLGLAMVASGCAGTAAQDTADISGASVPLGASLDEYRAAFADIEPITLQMQVGASSPDNYLGQIYGEFADDVHEWSDGTVTINLNWAGSIAALTEVDDALSDGRLDLGQLSFTYQPQEFPVNNNMNDASVLGSVSPLTGEIAQHLAMMQASSETPAVIDEYAEKGITALIPLVAGGSTGIACTEPITSLEDFQGRQILSNSVIQSKQIEGLGGIVTSVEYTELYEAMQRGIVDCALAVPPVYNGTGVDTVAPYFYYPEGVNFQAGPTSILAGSSWSSLSLPVQQVIYDKLYDWLRNMNHASFRFLTDSIDELSASGGEITYLDEEISDALRGINEEIIAEQSAADFYDAAGYAQRYVSAMEHWQSEAEAAGYEDEGGYADFSSWYQGDLASPEADYLAEFYDSAFAQAAGANRPS